MKALRLSSCFRLPSFWIYLHFLCYLADRLIILLLLRNPQNQTEYNYEKLNLTIMVICWWTMWLLRLLDWCWISPVSSPPFWRNDLFFLRLSFFSFLIIKKTKLVKLLGEKSCPSCQNVGNVHWLNYFLHAIPQPLVFQTKVWLFLLLSIWCGHF